MASPRYACLVRIDSMHALFLPRSVLFLKIWRVEELRIYFQLTTDQRVIVFTWKCPRLLYFTRLVVCAENCCHRQNADPACLGKVGKTNSMNYKVLFTIGASKFWLDCAAANMYDRLKKPEITFRVGKDQLEDHKLGTRSPQAIFTNESLVGPSDHISLLLQSVCSPVVFVSLKHGDDIAEWSKIQGVWPEHPAPIPNPIYFKRHLYTSNVCEHIRIRTAAEGNRFITSGTITPLNVCDLNDFIQPGSWLQHHSEHCGSTTRKSKYCNVSTYSTTRTYIQEWKSRQTAAILAQLFSGHLSSRGILASLVDSISGF